MNNQTRKDFNQIKTYLNIENNGNIKFLLFASFLATHVFNLLVLYFVEFYTLKISLFNYISIIFFSILLLLDFLTVFIIFDIDNRKEFFPLYMGLMSSFYSLFFLMEYFDMMYYILKIPLGYVFIGIIGYVLTLIIWGLYFKKLLKDGYFSSIDRRANIWLLINIGLITSTLGLLIGNITKRIIPNDKNNFIMAIGFLIFSYCFSLGIQNIYKFYLLKKYKELINNK